MTIKEFKDFLIERKYKKISSKEYIYIDVNKCIIEIKIADDCTVIRITDYNADIGITTFINILTANIFDKLINYLKEQVAAINAIKDKICIEENKEIRTR